ncbi:MAG: permease prefix domain 1-containing protein [Treponema sp.]|nr:permease prefix domain 1-containing protein [Treponema sp.]
MNSKIKNYVDVLFNDIPNSRKAAELKEEILSNLNEHFEALIREGKSENQAYTEALAALGDVDELLKSIMPDKDESERLNSYKQKRARFTSIAVMLFILGSVFLIGLPGLSAVLGFGRVEILAILGLIIMLCFSAVAIGLIIYINMSIPQDIEPYITRERNKHRANFDTSTTSGKFLDSFMKIFWLLIVVIYFIVSFTTEAWHISWIIFLIGAALEQAIKMFAETKKSNKTKSENENE